MEHRFAGINDALPSLAHHLLRYGHQVPSRNGGSLELLYPHIVFTRPLARECVLPSRAASLPALIAETAWVLAGRNDVEWLSHYLPRAKDFSDDGKTWRGGYGPSMRGWKWDHRHDDGFYTDQLAHVVDLLKHDPGERRAVISLYDPARDSAPGKDVPCNNWLHFLVRDGKLNLHVATRSNDFMWGWSGINAFQWSVLLEVVARLVGAEVGELHFSVSSFHVYDAYQAKTGRISEDSPQWPSPTADRFALTRLDDLDTELALFFKAEEGLRTRTSFHHPEVNDPMLRSWLKVLRWWWVGDVELEGVVKTAAELSPGRPRRCKNPSHTKVAKDTSVDAFKAFVCQLHEEKHAAYGDSWKRRGEMLGILANIARKVDRLGVAGGGDTSADTAIDLLVYLAKYRSWLLYTTRNPFTPQEDPSDTPAEANDFIKRLQRSHRASDGTEHLILMAKTDFAKIEEIVTNGPRTHLLRQVDWALDAAFELAYRLWREEQ